MIAKTLFGRDEIRKAGRATVVLQIFAVILLAILVSVYIDIAHRQNDLRDAVRENAMWSVYQFNREAMEAHQQLELMIASSATDLKSLKELSLRYDIVYSRMKTLKETKFEQNFLTDQSVATQLQKIDRAILNSEPVFTAINEGQQVSYASLKLLDYELGVLARETSELLVYTNTAIGVQRAEGRIELEALQHQSIVLIGLLVLSVVFLIFTLQRQLRGVQIAGKSLEAMASELSVSYQAAEAGNRAKSQFMATMGHEIRTPLNAILGMVELLELTRLSPEAAAHVRTIRLSGEALLDVINEILDYAKIEHGKLELERRSVDLAELAETSAEMMRGRASDTGSRIVTDLPQRWRARHVMSDPTRLRQVILNLMSNAVKFTSDGTVTLRMRQFLDQDGLWLRVEVQDTGIGIGEEGMQKLFRPFSQVDATISRKYGGTGLGLTICKEIIDRFGGRIGIDSALGRGSTFWFELPAQAARMPLTGGLAQPDGVMKPLGRLNILVVEDNKVNQQVILGYLKHLDQQVTIAENGEVAVAVAAGRQFDLILMDMQMPVMDGIEATRRIRASDGLSHDTPIVALTANASEEDRQACLDAGMAGFQAKPLSIATLRRLVAETVQQRREEPAQVSHILETSQQGTIASPSTAFPQNEDAEAAGLPDSVLACRREIEAVLGPEAFAELMQEFFDDAAELLVALRQSADQGGDGRLDILLHSLKGAAANVGLMDISRTSQALRHSRPTPHDIEMLHNKVNQARQAMAA